MTNPTSYTDEQVLAVSDLLLLHKLDLASECLRSLMSERQRLQAEVEACVGVLSHLEFALLGGRRCPWCVGWTNENGESDRHHADDCQLAAILAKHATPNETKEAKS